MAQLRDSLVFLNVRLTHSGVEILDGRGTVERFEKLEVEKLELRRGFMSKHPAVQVAFGAGMVWLGLEPARSLLQWFQRGGTMSEAAAMLVLLIPGGIWVVYDAFKRGYFLVVASRGKRHSFPLRGDPTEGEVKSFLEAAKFDLRYEIVATIRGAPRQHSQE